MSDIFEEVDESLRQDRISQLWKKYGLLVWLAAGLLIAAVAFNEYRSYRAAEDALARGAALDAAVAELEAGNFEAAQAGLQAIVDSDSAISPLAAHYLAQAKFLGGGDAEGAAELLVGVGKVSGSPYEKLALLKGAYFRADTLTLGELEATLGGLVEDEGAVGALARELVAAKTYADGNIASARTQFNRLKFDPAAPQGVRQRAEIALAAMPPAPGEDAAPTTEDTPPETAPTETPAETAATDEETEETSP